MNCLFSVSTFLFTLAMFLFQTCTVYTGCNPLSAFYIGQVKVKVAQTHGVRNRASVYRPRLIAFYLLFLLVSGVDMVHVVNDAAFDFVVSCQQHGKSSVTLT